MENRDSQGDNPKRKKHRGGKKRRNRRQSFAATVQAAAARGEHADAEIQSDRPGGHADLREDFYRQGRGNRSTTSLESEALLDHRDSGPLQTRRQSIQQGLWGSKSQLRLSGYHGQSNQSSSKLSRVQRPSDDDGDGDGDGDGDDGGRHNDEDNDDDNNNNDNGDEEADDHTPLIAASRRRGMSPGRRMTYGGTNYTPVHPMAFGSFLRQASPASSRSSRRKTGEFGLSQSGDRLQEYHVNNPPSVPNSPNFGPSVLFDDLMTNEPHESVIDIDPNGATADTPSQESPELGPGSLRRRMTMPAADDVCFPLDVLSEIAEEECVHEANQEKYRVRKRRSRKWPDLSILEEWSTEEKEGRTMEGIRTRKVNEPLLVDGRLRPHKTAWHRETEDQPYRFTYFNEEFQTTVHSQTISELLQPGQTFRDLFIPLPPELSDESSEEEEDETSLRSPLLRPQELDRKTATTTTTTTASFGNFRNEPLHSLPSIGATSNKQRSSSNSASGNSAGRRTPPVLQTLALKPKRYGSRPVFWLDVLCPTDAEMRVLSKAFSIHPLTTEDIMMQEAREKVELFQHYYFVNYRSFEQDTSSEDYLEPVNVYVVVFREGIVSFHFSQTPHPANVRRRIRQLSDYLYPTTDWISYAVIDDITDAYAPLIEVIEEEVDEIDQVVLDLHTIASPLEAPSPPNRWKAVRSKFSDRQSEAGDNPPQVNHRDMLRRVGNCRKKVMGLYRLLGTKADVIKGFAKRCNEQWEVAPRSEIGLYLGDIQDHIVTMTGNLSHYENLLSRAHSNYLAQISIRMNERSEKTNDVLGKLTVLGTIVLPMNIITGMWGMNVLVPGQEKDSLAWFWCITAGLFLFGLTSYLVAKRSFGIV